MLEGIYEVTFYQSSDRQADYGNGIVTIKDGAMNGGDEGYIYSGKLTESDNRVTGRLAVSKWSQASASVFYGLDNYELDFTGDRGDGDSLDGWATVVGALGKTLFISAHRIGDAA